MRLALLLLLAAGVRATLNDCLDAFLAYGNSSDVPVYMALSGQTRTAALSMLIGGAPSMGNYPACQLRSDTQYCYNWVTNVGLCAPAVCDEYDFANPELQLMLAAAAAGTHGATDELSYLVGALTVADDPAWSNATAADVLAAAALAEGASLAWARARPEESATLQSVATQLAVLLASESVDPARYAALQQTLRGVELSLNLASGFPAYVFEQAAEFATTVAVTDAGVREETGIGAALCGDQSIAAKPGTYIMVTLTVLMTLLVAFASYYDWLRKRHLAAREDLASKPVPPLGYDGLTSEKLADESSSEEGDEEGGGQAALEEPLVGHVQARSAMRSAFRSERSLPTKYKWLLFWAVQPNLAYLWPSKARGPFAVLDGIRALSMCWVVLGHTLFWSEFGPILNWEDVLPPDGLMGTWHGQVLSAAEFSVDTFFFLSAFLASWSMLRFLRSAASGQSRSLKWVPMAWLHRYLRLTPCYAFVIFFYMFVVPTFGNGPNWHTIKLELAGGCDKYWWQNLLYVSTMVKEDIESACFGVSWYLSSEFPMFVLLPLFVLAYHRSPKAGVALTAVAITASFLWSFIKGHQDGWSSYVFSSSAYSPAYYLRPWTRYPAYGVGVLFGFFWTWWTERARAPVPRNVVWALTAAYLAIFYSCAYGVLGEYTSVDPATINESGWSNTSQLTYTVLSKPGWCVGLAFFCFLSFTGNGGVPAFLMDRVFWVPIARLSFAAYLVHSVVLETVYYSQKLPFVYDGTWWCIEFLGVLCTTFGVSLVLHLVVEKPMDNLERAVMRK